MFNARKVTSQHAHYAFVVEKPPSDVALKVADLLSEVTAEKPYDTLKDAILYRTGESEERRLHDLFNNHHLGHYKPSQLLRKMKALLGDNTMSDTVLRKLWMDKLSPQTSQILVSLPDDLDLQRLQKSRTKYMRINLRVRDSQELSKIKDCIAELTSQLQALQIAVHQQNRTPNNFTRRPRPSHHTRRRSRSTSRSRPIFDTCWYHFKYGQHVRHCTKPCNFDINAAKDNNTQQSGNDYPGNK
ncbi:unnamed protein product [Acanthosepion pharaonis]|uniref:DUF7041 domain-containing protein n=1 Tax=Acanthosepion pharaonis TaxID=158019 RepID=A0A812CCI0_ACAPH|nr:unnamed protein product [Sepia pharaonis]